MKAKKQQINFVQPMRQFDRVVSANFGSLNPNFIKEYGKLALEMGKISQVFIPHVIQLGKLQLMRRLIIRQVNFSAKIESAQYQSTLHNLNGSMLRNIDEIRQKARIKLVDQDEELLKFS